MKKIPVIFDCDPGVDDAFAMALLKSYTQFDIKGITAVYGNMALSKTSYNALALANVLNIDCPVCKGADKPIYKRYDRSDSYESPVHGKTGTGDIVFPLGDKKFSDIEACDFIYETAKACDGALILFAIGPLTNVAKALMRYPDLPKYIRAFYIMGGGIHMGNQTPFAEANICKDPMAARICFENLTTYMVGLNATHAAALKKQDFEEMRDNCPDNPAGNMIRAMINFSAMNAFEQGSDSNVIHDALTIALAADASVCTLEHHYVYTQDDPYAENDGETVIDDARGAPNTFVALDTDNRKFKDIMVNMCKFYK